jgi:two-component system CheB/CheR fusion protein
MSETTDQARHRERETAPVGPPATPVVVGIGASAGGLEALQKFFATITADSGLAYVVVVHLSPDHESHLADILQPRAPIPVEQVAGEPKLEANRIYVIPPGRNIEAVDSHVRLKPLEMQRSARAPIDHFFRTLAETHDGSTVGVILSGTGSDGAEGVRHIREGGGMVVVQEPREATFDGMPRNAINSGVVDVVAPIADMMGHILGFARTRPRFPRTDEVFRSTENRPDPIQQILTVVRLRTGQDFTRYKRSTVARRIGRRMQIVAVRDIADYLELVRENAREAAALLDDLLINVTRFFRDPDVFDFLAGKVIPKMFDGKTASDRVRVWSVGCSTGEEAYSLGLLLLEEAGRRTNAPPVQVFASDLHESSLRYAREGLYPAAIEEDVSEERLQRFFRREDGGYRITKALRDVVVFAAHNLLQDPPFSRLDLVVCRNVLIYLQSDAQREVIELFHYSLQGAGCLLLGTAETLDRSDLFRLEHKESHLYRRRDVRRSELRLPAFPSVNVVPPPAVAGEPPPRAQAAQSYNAVHLRMVEQYAPPSLLVDQDLNVVHFSENVGRYLQHPGGVPTVGVFKLVREELRVELRATLHASRERPHSLRSRPISLDINGEARQVVLRVSPSGDGALEGLTLVIFDEFDPNDASTIPRTVEADATVRELETELDLARNRLQTILEEFETSQEEMRASNEELQSANEELRSTMEELETSREELQSINEELQTLNQENKHKVEELSQLTNDLQNLLQATDVATLFLDRSLRILRYTPRVSDIFNVRHSDRGRPLDDLTHRLRYQGLIEDAKRVLQTLVPIEREVDSQDGNSWYVVRATPYRTMEDRIEGVVITLVDVTALKRSETALRTTEARFRAVANLVPDLLWQSAPDGADLWFNDRWHSYTGQSPAEAEGLGWLDVVHPDDQQESRKEWAASMRGGGDVFRREHRVRRSDGVYRWFLSRAEPIRDDAGRVVWWFGAASDVHEQLLAIEEVERRVAERTSELARANAALEDAAVERNALRRQLTAAEEDERRRLARELHDQLGQHLTALGLGLADARRLITAGESSDARLTQLEELSRAIARDARYLALELRPPELDDVGLASAVETYVAEWSRRFGVKADMALSGFDGPATIRGDVGTAIYRVVQEALTNVAKHARARQVSVTLERSGGEVRVTVEDDGRGFDVDSALARAHTERRLGLAGIQERATLANGSAQVESSIGGGTSVFVRVPE